MEMQMPDMCAPALPLPDAPKSGHHHIDLGSAYLEYCKNANARHVGPCIAPHRHPNFGTLKWTTDMYSRCRLKQNISNSTSW